MSYEKDYVKKHLGEPLTLALTEICLKRPKDPMLFLAQWLLHWQKIKGQIGREREKLSKENENAEEIQSDLEVTEGSEHEYLENAIVDDNEVNGGYKLEGYGTYEWKVDSENVKEEVELGYPFSLAYSLGEREKRSYEEAALMGVAAVRTYSSELQGIEQMIAEMVADEIAHYVPVTRRDSMNIEEGIDQGCSVLGRNSLEDMLKEYILQRILEGKLKKSDTEIKMDSTETLEKLKQEFRVLVRNHLDELLTEVNLERIIAEKVKRKRSKIKFGSDSIEDVSKQGSKGNSLEEMIKEQIFQRIVEKKVEISRSRVKFDSDSVEDESMQNHEVTEGSSLEKMIREKIFQRILAEKVATYGSGINLGPEGTEDKVKEVGKEETGNSLEDVLKEQIFQWIFASKTERSDSEGNIVFNKDKFDGDISLRKNSLEEILKEQIFQRMEAAKAADSNTKVEIDSKNSLEEAIREEILKRMLAANIENKDKEAESNSDDGEEHFKQDSKVGEGNSLAEILKEEFLQRMVAEKVDSSNIKYASNDDTERVGDYYIVTETNSVKETIRERSSQGIAIEEVQNDDPEKKTVDAEGLIEGYTVTEADSLEQLPEESLLIYPIIEEEDEDIIPI